MKFSIKDFFSKCEQIRSLLKKFLIENMFYAVFGEKIFLFSYSYFQTS